MAWLQVTVKWRRTTCASSQYLWNYFVSSKTFKITLCARRLKTSLCLLEDKARSWICACRPICLTSWYFQTSQLYTRRITSSVLALVLFPRLTALIGFFVVQSLCDYAQCLCRLDIAFVSGVRLSKTCHDSLMLMPYVAQSVYYVTSYLYGSIVLYTRKKGVIADSFIPLRFQSVASLNVSVVFFLACHALVERHVHWRDRLLWGARCFLMFSWSLQDRQDWSSGSLGMCVNRSLPRISVTAGAARCSTCSEGGRSEGQGISFQGSKMELNPFWS